MTDTDGPFDGKPWSEAQWARHAAQWAPSGVYGPPAASTTTGDLPLSVSGLSVGLGAGRAGVRGFGFERTGAAVMQAVTANTHGSFNRRDRIVLRRNLATHTITPVLLTGTPASGPSAPALAQSEVGSWDLPMFSFLVPPNSGTGITGLVDERAFIDPDSNCLAVYGAGGLTALAARPSIIAGQRAYTSSDKRYWRYDGSGWQYAGGAPPPIVLCPLVAGWVTIPGRAPAVYKDGDGLVHVVGGMRPQSTYNPNDGTPHTAITLPAGYRPALSVPVMAQTASGYLVGGAIGTDGVLNFTVSTLASAAAGMDHYLDGIPPFHPGYVGGALS